MLFALIYIIYNKRQYQLYENNIIRIYYNGFWPNFNTTHFNKLFELVYNKKIINDTPENSTILVESLFSNSMLNTKKWEYTYFFRGESEINIPYDQSQYDCILGTTKINNKYIPFPLFLLTTLEHIDYHYTFPIKNKLVVPNINGILIIVGGNDIVPIRKEIIKRLEDFKLPLYFGGKYRNNIGGSIESEFGTPEFYKILSNYKFILTFENSSEDYYISEKIFHGFMSNTIPIYWGSKKIDTFFNKNRYINIDNIYSDDWINNIIILMNNDQLYLNMVNQNVYPIENKSIITINTIANDIKKLITN